MLLHSGPMEELLKTARGGPAARGGALDFAEAALAAATVLSQVS